jgi:hypothetical protein
MRHGTGTLPRFVLDRQAGTPPSRKLLAASTKSRLFAPKLANFRYNYP